MKRERICLAAALLLLLGPAGCSPQSAGGTGGSEPVRSPAATAPAVSAPVPTPTAAPPEPAPSEDPGPILSDVCAAMAEAVGETDPLGLDTEAILGLYGMDPAWVVQTSGFIMMNGVLPDEIVIAEAADADAAEQIAASLRRRLDDTLEQASLYDPETYASLEGCAVNTDGLYVSLFLSPLREELDAVYRRYITG